MRFRTLLQTLPALGLLTTAPGAGATTLTNSFDAWRTGIGSAPYSTTVNTGLFDDSGLYYPTTSAIPLSGGYVLSLSTPAEVTQPGDGFPYLLANGGTPDLFIPLDAAGNPDNQVRTETISFASSISALGFSVVPFSNSQTPGGPYNITLQLANGQSLSASLPGATTTFPVTTATAFFGFYGGGVTSLTLTTSDPNGFAFGNFVDVPEPASLALLAGATAILGLARRTARGAGAPRQAA